MDIELYRSTKAQPLDDEGDPKGEPVVLKPGKYRLRSGITMEDDGTFSAWIEGASGRLYQAYNMNPSA